MLPQILIALIPALVSQAEKLFPAPQSGPQKHEWVLYAIDDILSSVMKDLNVPEWFLPIEEELKKLCDEAIVAAVAKIDP